MSKVGKPLLCCIVNPYVVCVECLMPSCERCSHDETKQSYHRYPCEGHWFSPEHEAIYDNAKVKYHYMPGGKYYHK